LSPYVDLFLVPSCQLAVEPVLCPSGIIAVY
jgi:hypothetical protein